MRLQEGVEDPYCEHLQQLGVVRCIPVLSFTFVNLELLYTYLASSEQWAGIILTSKRAVEAIKLAVGQPGLPSEWESKQCFVVGEATSKVAGELGFACTGSECGNASKLADVIKSSSVSTLPLLFVCGSLRRDTLPDFMKSNNIAYKSVIVYETIACSSIRKDIQDFVTECGPPSHIVYFSPSGYQFSHHIWEEELAETADDIRLVAIGTVTSREIKGPVLVAKKPNPQSLCEVIKNNDVT